MLRLRIVLLCSLFCTKFRVSNSASAFVLSSSREAFSSFTPRKDMCYLEGKVLYRNSCYQLNTQGPCEENERLVLDSDAASRANPIFEAICLEKSCQGNDIYWPQDNYCYTPDSTKDLCQTKGTSVQIDMFGEGYCDCIQSPPHARMPNVKGNAPCYQLYTRAQCKQHQYLVENSYKTECIFNPCSFRGSNFVPWKDGSCHRLRTRGPCNTNEEFTILEDTKEPGCKETGSSNPLFVVDIPMNCKPDHGGECAEEFSIARGEEFRFQLLRSAERARKRKKKNC
ncbi:uncharacterized protein LOC103517994 [Diaphorina citri]|uniref:Uncharacterized protein LOC103517994 n=1 Tax=Diaphorina citri TaxID=121845 RepID=A0A1S3DHT3_DIACI|nr:uncharacterized protein LOC103517994 [Diaphorina citri]